MPLSRPRLSVPVLLVAFCVVSGVVAAPDMGVGASTAPTVVSATVPSAITLQDACTHDAARRIGAVTPGSGLITATGANVCRYSFSSTNSSSMLRLYQADRTTQAMVGRPTVWTSRQGSGATLDLADAGTTLMLAQNTWSANGRYHRSTDGGASWTQFDPGGGLTPTVSAPSSTVAWRMGNGVVWRSTTMQDPTPSWTSINPNKVGGGTMDVMDVDAIDASTAWAVGYPGIYRTANAGATDWSYNTGACTNPSKIDAPTASTAFVIGWSTICRTTTSNATWTQQMTGIPATMYPADIGASPETVTHIWTVGSRGRVARSTNNGDSWALVTALPIPVDLVSIDVRSDLEVWVGGLSGLVFRTDDGGSSWDRITAPVTGPIHGISAPSAATYTIAPNYGGPQATANTGSTWNAIVGIADATTDVDAVDTDLLVLAQSAGNVGTSTNGGTTVTARAVGFGARNVRGVAVIDATTILAVGDAGSIAISTDAGASWTQRASGTSEDLWDVDVTSEGVAIAVGAGGTILRSVDGGWQWTTRSSTGADLRKVDARSGAPVIAVGMAGAIRRSTDGGITWTTPASGVTGNFTSVSVASDTTIYAAFYGTLVKSIDGGASWTNSLIGDMAIVEAITPDVVWLTTSHVGGWAEWADYSLDGGATWAAAWSNNDPDVTSVHAIDGGRLIFAGTGGGLRTSNPPTTVGDYSAGGWAGATSMFGACLQDVGGSASVGAWTEDGGTCIADDSDNWYPVPTAPVKVAQMAAAGTGNADIVWGFKAGAGATPTSYVAGIVVEAVAPNA